MELNVRLVHFPIVNHGTPSNGHRKQACIWRRQVNKLELLQIVYILRQ